MRKGFTLIELLVVLSILIVIGVVAVTKSGDITDEAKWARAAAEANQNATAAILYFQENGEMPPDSGGSDFYNAPFYATYISGITPIDEPSSYLGPGYTWDWENWGRSPSGSGWIHTQPRPFMCWQSIDLRGPSNLVLRKCVRNACVNQLYCDENGICYNSAQDRDSYTNSLGHYWDIPASAVCEDCVGEEDCARKFLPDYKN